MGREDSPGRTVRPKDVVPYSMEEAEREGVGRSPQRAQMGPGLQGHVQDLGLYPESKRVLKGWECVARFKF